jgi:hypothetical protein
MSDTMKAITRFRKATLAIRGIRYRQRTGRLTGRNGAATDRTLTYHRQVQDEAIGILILSGHRELAGLLSSEAGLADRVREARILGQRRPELEMRLRRTRAQVHALTYRAA